MEQLQVWWQTLDAAQRRAIRLGSPIAAALFILLGVILPLWQAHSAQNKTLTKRLTRVGEMVALERVAADKRENGFIKPQRKRLGNDTPISFIEGIATQAGVKEKLTNIKPGPTSSRGENRYGVVSFQLKDLTMIEMVDFMHSLEKGLYEVRIQRFEAESRNRRDEFLELRVEVELLL